MEDLTKRTDEELKEEFTTALLNAVDQKQEPRMQRLLSWLENATDFYTAPASAKYHSNHRRGLLEHSLYVYHRMVQDYIAEYQNTLDDMKPSSEEMEQTLHSIAIVSLLHDVCKTNFYMEDTKRAKVNGEWIDVPYYRYREDALNFGHGEESVYILQNFIRLTREEAFAIRFHMGDFEDRNTSRAFGSYPLSIRLHVADLEATYLDEGFYAKKRQGNE